LRVSGTQVHEILGHYDLRSVRSVAWLAAGYWSDDYTLLTDRGKYRLLRLDEKEYRVEYVLGLSAFLEDGGPDGKACPHGEGPPVRPPSGHSRRDPDHRGGYLGGRRAQAAFGL
jgi:hypothetical protein